MNIYIDKSIYADILLRKYPQHKSQDQCGNIQTFVFNRFFQNVSWFVKVFLREPVKSVGLEDFFFKASLYYHLAMKPIL